MAGISPQLPADYQALLWQESFASRGRGVDLGTHVPWLLSPRGGARFATLRQEGALLAGLTWRQSGPELVALGLVCVKPELRGQGLARRLLAAALAEIDREGHAATILWTRQPGIYCSQGFAVSDESLRLEVQGWRSAPREDVRVQAWPDDAEVSSRGRGLPPFARAGLRARGADDTAALILLEDSMGLQLVEHQGTSSAVLDLLRAVAPGQWRMHATSRTDPVVRSLTSMACDATGGGLAGDEAPLSVTVSNEALQMWRPHPRLAGTALPPATCGLLDRL